MILKDSAAFKSATSNTALNDTDWYFITITHDGNLTLGNRTKIYINGVDDTISDNTTNNVDAGEIAYRIFAKTDSEALEGHFQYLSLLDVTLDSSQILDLYNSGKPKNSQTEYGSNCKLFINPDNTGSTAEFTISDSVNSIDFIGSNMEDSDKVTDTMYNAVVLGIGMMQIGSTFIIS